MMETAERATQSAETLVTADSGVAGIARHLVLISMFHFVNDAAIVSLSIVYPLLYDQGFIITHYSYIGTLFLAGLGITVITQFLIGTFSREEHFKNILPAAIMGLGLSLALITRTDRFLTFLVVFLLIRTSTSFYHPIGIAWTNSLARGERLDRSMGIQSSMGDLGVFVSFIAGGILAERMGWRFPLLTWACIAIVVALFGFFMSTRRWLARRKPASMPATSVLSWRESYRSVRPLIPAFLLGGISWVITVGYAPSLFHHKLSVSLSHTGYILACWIGAGTIASLLYGRIVPFVGHRRLLITSYTMVLLNAVVLWNTQNSGIAMVAMGCFGFFLFLTYPCLLSCVGKKIADASGPSAFSIVANLQILGGAVFSFAAGFLSDSYGIESPFKMLAAASAAVVLYLLLRGSAFLSG